MNATADDLEPDSESVAIMRAIDRLPPEVRVLIHEYGFVIVRNMLNEGYPLKNLAAELADWRSYRQAQWFGSDYVSGRTLKSIVDAAMRK